MKRFMGTLVALATLLVCSPTFMEPFGGKAYGVSVTDCAQLQTQWATEAVQYLGWHITTADQADWDVQCTDLGPFAGTYNIGTSRVLFNPGAVHDGFTARATIRHEFVHLILDHGPRPETAVLHLCDWAYNESPPAGCYTKRRVRDGSALMSKHSGMEWNGEQERIMPGAVAEERITEPDRELIAFGLPP